ncbi:MAG: hypothetical protein C4576_11490 [Desulfobacteraceae bacterium]|nr:MAG: hypothetical protein C4576_11490 [Desulfobacteraceae bacterium]
MKTETPGGIPIEPLKEPKQCSICERFSLEGVTMERTTICVRAGAASTEPFFMCENCVRISFDYRNAPVLGVFLQGRVVSRKVFLN